jgi:hypothetical protein
MGILVLAGPLYYNGDRGRGREREGEGEIYQRSWGVFGDSSVSASIPFTAIISYHIQTNAMGFLLLFNAPKLLTVPPIYFFHVLHDFPGSRPIML